MLRTRAYFLYAKALAKLNDPNVLLTQFYRVDTTLALC